MNPITIICEEHENPVAAVSELLGAHQINIVGLDYKQAGEVSVLSVRTGQYDEALVLLTGAGYNAVADDFVIIRGQNRPGELAQIARTLGDAGVQIRSLTLLETHENMGLVSIATDDNDKVRALFSAQLVN